MPDCTDANVRLQLLGPVRAWRGDTELQLGSSFRRGVLAVLACSPAHVVTRHELVDALWGDSPPPSASGSLYTYVSDLRRVLEPGRPRRGDGVVLTSAGSGYTLSLARDDIDLFAFVALCNAAEAVGVADNPNGALADLEKALGLWRGDALLGVPGPFAAAQRARLAELRLNAVERRAELMLHLGRQSELVDELSTLCTEHPSREPLHGQLMRALEASGRTADALAVFARLAETLREESGLDPGTELQALRQRMTDPPAGPDWTSGARRATALSPPRPMRADIFVGRRAELEVLRGAAADVVAGRGGALWIEGEPGIGKSALLAEAVAEVSGATVCWTNAHELDSRAPFRLIGDLLGLLGDDPVRTGDDPEDALRRVSAVVRQLCSEQPLILVADDLQWADEASLKAWWHLRTLANVPLLQISASRQIPRRPEVEQLRERLTGCCTALTLGPLAPNDVHLLVDALLHPPVAAPPHRQTADGAGNPWYIRQIIASQNTESGYAGSHAGENSDRSLSPRLTTLVNDHLAFASEETLATLKRAALLGGDFTTDELAAAVGRPASELSAQLSETQSAGILVCGERRHRFRHPLVRRALYEGTPRALRGVLHRQLAEALAGTETPPYRVAEQLVAMPAAADAWVVDWLSANISAVAAQRPYVAVRLLRQVIGFGTLSPGATDLLRGILAWLLFWLGEEPELETRSALARATDPDRMAEFRWILAHIYRGRGRLDAALAEIGLVLSDERVVGDWRVRHQTLLSALNRETPFTQRTPGDIPSRATQGT